MHQKFGGGGDFCIQVFWGLLKGSLSLHFFSAQLAFFFNMTLKRFVDVLDTIQTLCEQTGSWNMEDVFHSFRQYWEMNEEDENYPVDLFLFTSGWTIGRVRPGYIVKVIVGGLTSPGQSHTARTLSLSVQTGAWSTVVSCTFLESG
jgi:hypothetical protein